MKNPPTKKFGSNSDERESYFPSIFDPDDQIDSDRTSKRNSGACSKVTN